MFASPIAAGVFMIIGAMNNPRNNLTSEIELFGEMGFDYVEVTVEAPAAHPQKIIDNKKHIVDALHSYNFGVLSHFPWYFSIAHPYPYIQKAINHEFVKAFDAASLLGAKKATIHPEFLPPGLQERPVRIAKIVETLKYLNKEANERGLELLLENFSNSAWFSIKDFKQVFSEVGIGMAFDIGHAAIKDAEGIDEHVQKLKKKIKHVHLHDNNKREDQHLPLGAGRINIPKAVRMLKSFYDGTITLEVHSEDRDYLKLSKDKLEILWFGKKRFEQDKGYIFPK